MKRLIVGLALIGLAALPLSNLADPDPINEKIGQIPPIMKIVTVCHVTPASFVGHNEEVYGKLLDLPLRAWEAQIAQPGNGTSFSVDFIKVSPALRDKLEEYYGVSLGSADCVVGKPPIVEKEPIEELVP